MRKIIQRFKTYITNDVLISWLLTYIPKVKRKDITPVPPTNLEMLIEKWVQLDPHKADDVFSSYKAFKTVGLCAERVLEYRVYLQYIVQCYQTNVSCQRQKVVLPRNEVKLKHFFLDDKGYFLDPVKETILLRNEVLDFLHHYNQSALDGSTYEARRTNSLVRNLIVELDDLYHTLSS